MYSKKLLEFCKEVKPIKLAVTKNVEELDYKKQILELTSFLDIYNKTPLSLRYYCIFNSINSVPICKCCDNPVTYKKDYPDQGFAEYCSSKCSRSDKTVDKEILKKLSNKEWLYEQRITLQKSKEIIAEELGCSTSPINKWLKFHQIPDIKYNESNSFALSKLRDHSWLYKEHVINHKSCEEIGNFLNVSKSTISIYLAKHNIEANETNSYDRKESPSDECMEIVNFIKTFYTKEILLDKRNVIGSLELDIYLPEDNFAIEYNGTYSHIYRPEETSFSKRKDIKYHVYKTNECEKKNIQLIHIFSGQWKENKEVWKSFIKNKLGFTDNKIYARQCIIKKVSIHEKRIFLLNNHIQGDVASTHKFGLYYNDELVSLITFSKSRYNKNYDWELIRFCNKINYNVVGGFSKLLLHFRKLYTGTIISYANRTYSNGHLYENNGFTLLSINKPSYYYIKKNSEKLLHKTNFKKKHLLKELNKPEWTEKMLSQELGYNIIYDCGTKVYIIK